MLDNRLREKIKFANVTKEIAKLNYPLPTFLVSFPRSGSNFLQSVLQGSSGIRCQSIYGPSSEDTDTILSLKSHAISYEYLLDEIHRFIPKVTQPSKLLLLYRDPRDVMISFLEYTQVNRKVQIPQEDFLENVSFFYAAGTIDKTFERKVEYGPMSIIDVYKKHIRKWFIDKPDSLDCLVVKFEDLVLSPDKGFKRIFDFLELDCSLAKELLDVKVSQYDQARMQRGQAGGWRTCQDLYGKLLSQVQTLLRHEIEMLGYEK